VMARGLLRAALSTLVLPLVLTSCGTLPPPPWVPRLSWREVPVPVNPPGRVGAAIAYDAETHQVVLFGGHLAFCCDVVDDTWTWNGVTWTEQHPPVSPPAMSGGSMAYDAATHQLILFGGGRRLHAPGSPLKYSAVGPPLDGTWTWNGTTWIELHPAVSPPPRAHAAMAYDPATREIVLFGGFGPGGRLRDTWTWNGATWTEVHTAVQPGPLPYTLEPEQLMAYDPALRKLVLYEYIATPRSITDGSTWTWNGTTWAEQHPSAIPSMPCVGGVLSETPVRGVLMLAGRVCPSANPRIWFWNGRTWYGAPAPKKGLPDVMYDAYDSSLHTIVVQQEDLITNNSHAPNFFYYVAHTWLVKMANTASHR